MRERTKWRRRRRVRSNSGVESCFWLVNGVKSVGAIILYLANWSLSLGLTEINVRRMRIPTIRRCDLHCKYCFGRSREKYISVLCLPFSCTHDLTYPEVITSFLVPILSIKKKEKKKKSQTAVISQKTNDMTSIVGVQCRSRSFSSRSCANGE